MPVCRTEWSKKAVCAMIMNGYTVQSLAKELGLNWRYLGSVMYGRSEIKAVKKQVSDKFGILDE